MRSPEGAMTLLGKAILRPPRSAVELCLRRAVLILSRNREHLHGALHKQKKGGDEYRSTASKPVRGVSEPIR